jgi:hypothetical protein
MIESRLCDAWLVGMVVCAAVAAGFRVDGLQRFDVKVWLSM